jgi:predicted transcriptional regulator
MQTQTNLMPTSVKLPGDLRDRIQNLAKVRKRTPHSIMIQALETYVAREEQREAFRQEAIAAWDEYLRIGMHLTGDEADSWLADLENGNDVEPPKCHI